MIFIHYCYVLFFVNSVLGENNIFDEGKAALVKMKQEMNSKRTPNEDKLKLRINF